MTKNPIVNGIGALAYIVAIALIMFFGTKNLPKQDTIFAPIAMISLFTLSAAVMGYIFMFQPAQLYFEDKKKQAVKLFLQTVLTFGFMTAIMLVQLFTGIFA